ncbi:MAG: hypothetical protein ABMA01_03630 [Chthoniobacteraceae bacterium]
MNKKHAQCARCGHTFLSAASRCPVCASGRRQDGIKSVETLSVITSIIALVMTGIFVAKMKRTDVSHAVHAGQNAAYR